MSDNGKCKVYTAVSGKGGAGKSTVVCGLGIALAGRGLKTLLIDADEGLRCLDLMLGVTDKLLFDMSDALEGRCKPNEAVLGIDGVSGLDLMCAPLEYGTVGARLCELVDSLRSYYDCIIIDSTAGVGEGFKAAVKAADAVIAVVGSDPVSIRDARGVCELLDGMGIKSRRMIINRFDYVALRYSLAPQIDRMIDDTALRLVGIVPYDWALTTCAIKGKPIKKGRAYKAFVRIAARLCGKNVKLPKLKKI